MPTAPMKRHRLQDMDMPMSKRSKTSHGFQDVYNPQQLETDNISSPMAKMIGGNFKNFMLATERRSTKTRKSTKGSSTLSSTRMKNIPNESISSKREVTSSKNVSITKKTTTNMPSSSRITSSTNSSTNQTATNNASNTVVYKCKLCWRRYPRKSLIVLHNQAVHRTARKTSPVFCDKCGITFTNNIGHGPWKDCCMADFRKYIMLRYNL